MIDSSTKKASGGGGGGGGGHDSLCKSMKHIAERDANISWKVQVIDA